MRNFSTVTSKAVDRAIERTVNKVVALRLQIDFQAKGRRLRSELNVHRPD